MKAKVLLINLDRAPDRFESMCEQFGKLSTIFNRIRAIDGQALSQEEIDKYYSTKLNRKRYFVPLGRNEIACYMSHLKAFQKIIDDDLDYAVILEDDLILSDGFRYINKIIESIKEPWEYIKLINPKNKKKVVESNLFSVKLPINCKIEHFEYNKEDDTYLSTSREQKLDAPLAFELVKWNKVPILAAAYVIKREAAEKFIKAYPKCYRPIDVDLQHPWEHKIDIQGIAPDLVKLDTTKESTIGHKKLKRHYPLARIVYNLKYLFKRKMKKC